MFEFVQDYFIKPIVEGSGYNPVNTLVYAVLFVLGISLLRRVLEHFRVRTDLEFFKSLIPYFLFISSLRVLEDLGFAAHSPNPLDWGFYFGTPGIYLLGASLILGVLACLKAFKVRNEMKAFGLAGWALYAPLALFFLSIEKTLTGNGFGALQILALAFLLTYGSKLVLEKAFKDRLLSPVENQVVMFSGSLDAAATSIALSAYGYGEQHVLPNLFIGLAGTPYVFLLKSGLMLLVLHYLDSSLKKEKELNFFVKAAVTAVTLGPGFRDFLVVLALA